MSPLAARVAADLVLVVHALFLVFVTLGALLALRWPRMLWLHLPAVAWGAIVEFQGWVCPLTPMENRFRRLAGEGAYAGGFIERYVTALLYPQGLTREIQVALGVGVLVLNTALYVWVWRRRGRLPASPHPGHGEG